MVTWHLWLATLGLVIYAAVMWVAGVQQGLMWREYDDQGFLVYSFAETVAAMHPYYIMRAVGGTLYLAGALVMAFFAISLLVGHFGGRNHSSGAIGLFAALLLLSTAAIGWIDVETRGRPLDLLSRE